jgi:hypothetical protein
MPREQGALAHRRGRGGIGRVVGVGDDDRALAAETRERVTLLLGVGAGPDGEGPGAHDWLEVTALGVLVALEPVELPEPDELEPAVFEDTAPVEPLEPVELVVAPFALVVAPELDAAVFADVDAFAVAVLVLRDSAGSFPVIRTTAISAQSTRNSPTEYPITRLRIVRTRRCRICLILTASVFPMRKRIGSPRSKPVREP